MFEYLGHLVEILCLLQTIFHSCSQDFCLVLNSNVSRRIKEAGRIRHFIWPLEPCDIHNFSLTKLHSAIYIKMLRIPHCLDNRLIDGGKVVSPMHQLHFTPQKYTFFFNVSGTHFC
jgi:hypothetical protein